MLRQIAPCYPRNNIFLKQCWGGKLWQKLILIIILLCFTSPWKPCIVSPKMRKERERFKAIAL